MSTERGSLFAARECPTCGKRIGTADEWEGLPESRLDDRCWAEPGDCPAPEGPQEDASWS